MFVTSSFIYFKEYELCSSPCSIAVYLSTLRLVDWHVRDGFGSNMSLEFNWHINKIVVGYLVSWIKVQPESSRFILPSTVNIGQSEIRYVHNDLLVSPIAGFLERICLRD